MGNLHVGVVMVMLMFVAGMHRDDSDMSHDAKYPARDQERRRDDGQLRAPARQERLRDFSDA